MARSDDAGCPVQLVGHHRALCLRAATSPQVSTYLDDFSYTWMTFDYIGDAVYVIDMLLRAHTGPQNELTIKMSDILTY